MKTKQEVKQTFRKLIASLLIAVLIMGGVPIFAFPTEVQADTTSAYTVTFSANGKSTSVGVDSLPHTFWCYNDDPSGELDKVIYKLYGLTNYAHCNPTKAPSTYGGGYEDAGLSGHNHYFTINKVFTGAATVIGRYEDPDWQYSDTGDFIYNLTVTIKSNFVDNTMTLSPTSGTLTYPNSTTITANNNNGGAISAESSNTNVATVNVNGNNITITPAAVTSTATATITVKSAAKDNVLEGTKTYALTVIPGNLSISKYSYEGTYDGKDHNATIKMGVSGATIVSGTTTAYGNTVTNNSQGGIDIKMLPAFKNVPGGKVYFKATKAGYQDVTGEMNVTINPVTPQVTAPVVKDYQYTGTEYDLFQAGSVNPNFLKLQYRYQDAEGNYYPDENGTADVIKTKEIGDYTIQYRVNTTDHNTNDVKNVNVSDEWLTAGTAHIYDVRQAVKLLDLTDAEYAWGEEPAPETKTIELEGEEKEFPALLAGKDYALYANKELNCDAENIYFRSVKNEDNENFKFKYLVTVDAPEETATENNTVAVISHTHAPIVYSTLEAEGAEAESDKVYIECTNEYEKPEGGTEFETVKTIGAWIDIKDVYYYGEELPGKDCVELAEELYGANIDPEKITIKYYNGDGNAVDASALKLGETGKVEAKVPVSINGRITNCFISKDFSYSKRPLSMTVYEVEDVTTPIESTKVGEAGKEVDTFVLPTNQFTYDETEHAPVDKLVNPANEDVLNPETDYEVVEGGVTKGIEADTYTYVLAAKEDSNYEGEVTVQWTIAKADLPEGAITITAKDGIVYDGKEVDITDFELDGTKKDELITREDTGYTAKFYKTKNGKTVETNGKDAGVKTAKITLITKNYKDTLFEVPFEILKKDATIKPDGGQKITFGDEVPQAPTYTVEGLAEDDEPKEGEDATVFGDILDVVTTDTDFTIGTLTEEVPRVDGEGNPEYYPETEEQIIDIEEVTASYLNAGSYVYALQEDEDISEDALINNYEVSLTEKAPKFVVNRKSIAAETEGEPDVTATLTAVEPDVFDPDTTNFTYDGKTKSVEITEGKAYDNVLGLTLTEDADFKKGGTYQKVNPGTFDVQLLGNKNYTGTLKLAWSIGALENPATISYAEAYSGAEEGSAAGTKTYDGKDVSEMVEVALNGLPENKTTITWEYYPAKEEAANNEGGQGNEGNLVETITIEDGEEPEPTAPKWVIDGDKLEKAPKDAGDYIAKAIVKTTGYANKELELDVHVEKKEVTATAVLDSEEISFGDELPKVTETKYETLVEGEDEFLKDYIKWTRNETNTGFTGEEDAEANNEYAKNYTFTITNPTYTINAKDISSEDIIVTFTEVRPLAEEGFTECDDIVVKMVKEKPAEESEPTEGEPTEGEPTEGGQTTEEPEKIETVLVEGTDYTLNGDFTTTGTGEFIIEIQGKGNYTGVREIIWKVVKPSEVGTSEITGYEVADDQGRINFTYANTYDGEEEVSYGILVYRDGELTENMTVENDAYSNAPRTTAKGTFRIKDQGNGIYLRSYIKAGRDYIYGEQVFVSYEDLTYEDAITEITGCEIADDQGRIDFTYENTYEGKEEVSYGVLVYRGGELDVDMTIDDEAYSNAPRTAATGTFRIKDQGNGIYVRPYIKIGDKIKYGKQIFVTHEELANKKAFDEAKTEITRYEKADDLGRIDFTYENTYEGKEEVSYGVLVYRGGELDVDMTIDDEAYSNAPRTAATGTFRIKDQGNGIYVRPYIKIGEQVKYGEQVFVKHAELTANLSEG